MCLAAGVITRDQEIICPLDEVGKFVDPVTDFKGQYVKDADKNIIKRLKEDGRLVSASQIKHSYPFCWRSDTPLLYRYRLGKKPLCFFLENNGFSLIRYLYIL